MSVNAGVEGANTQGQPTGDNSQGAGTGTPPENTPQQQPQQTSPYAPYLEKLSETVRPMVEPIFKEWDSNVGKRFEQLHSQYSWAEPWKEISDQVDPDTASQALQVFQALSDNPEAFWKAVGEAYGYAQPGNGQQGQPDPNDPGAEELTDPRISQLQETVNTLAEIIMGDRETQQQSQEEEQFVQHLTQLHEKHGEFDLDYVLAKVAAGQEPEAAVLAYRALVGQQVQQQNADNAPVVMGSGGGVPSTTVEPKNLDRRQTQDFVASVLAANKGT